MILVHDKDEFTKRLINWYYDGCNGYSQDSIAFTCWMWSFDMDDRAHEDPTNLRSGVCNWLLSTGEDGVYTYIMAGIHYTHGGVSAM